MGVFENGREVRTAGAMLRFCVLSAFTWAGFMAALMAGTFMLGRGMSATSVGVVMMAGNGMALVIQPFISSIADGPGKLTSQRFGMLLALVVMVLMATCALATSDAVVMVSLACICMIAKNIPALTNSTSVYYQKRGAEIDYGVARSVGALADAASSAFVGFLVTRIGVEAIMYAGIVFHALLIAAFWTMPTPKALSSAHAEDASPEGTDAGSDGASALAPAGTDYLAFVRENPGYLLVVCGFALAKLMPQMLALYGILVFQGVGGTNADMGLAIAISDVIELPSMLLYGRLEKRFSTETMLVVAAIGCVARAVSTAVATTLTMLYIAYTFSLVEGFYNPSTVSYAGKCFGEADLNKAQGLMAMINPLGGIVGSLFGGVLVDTLGVHLFIDLIAAGAVLGLVLVSIGSRIQAGKAAADRS
ncbi:MAG: MFS transporter [Atopobiaceae bacterium]|nr:MFS transporter [Atopobiaceae bacterium]